MGNRTFVYTSTSDPTVDDDADAGYVVMDEWLNTSTPAYFKLYDSTVGAAVWREFTFASDRYTPDLTDTTNIASSSLDQGFSYLRVNDMVMVSGSVQITPTADATLTELNVSLPIASDLTTDYDLTGTGSTLYPTGTSNENGTMLADTTNDEAIFRFFSFATSVCRWRMVFMYQIQ